jgi:aspartyl-tRNA synthetase
MQPCNATITQPCNATITQPCKATITQPCNATLQRNIQVQAFQHFVTKAESEFEGFSKSEIVLFSSPRCYRDEGAKPDRQPEFTQVDIEVAFTDSQRIQNLIESLLVHSWPSSESEVVVAPLPKRPFPRLSFKEAMAKYGSDKPDLRIPNEIKDLGFQDGRFIKVVTFKSSQLTKELSRSASKVMETKVKALYPNVIVASYDVLENGQMRTSATKLLNGLENNLDFFEPGDVGFFSFAASEEAGQSSLGKVRSFIGEQRFISLNPDDLRFLWVVDFPLFVKKDDLGGLEVN